MARTVLFVVGMHRSGTSALAGSLIEMGAAAPSDLLPPQDDNPRGFFESQRANAIHDDLLLHLDRSWDDVSSLPDDWLQHEAVEVFRSEARALLDDLPDHGLAVMKDPRLSRLLPAWRRFVLRDDEPAVALLVTRPAEEVVSSLQRRDGVSAAVAWMLLATYLREAIQAVEGMPTAVVSYPAALDSWEAELAPALDHLGVRELLPSGRNESVDGFLTADLRHSAEALATTSVSELLRMPVLELLAALEVGRPVLTEAVAAPLQQLAEVLAGVDELTQAAAEVARARLAHVRADFAITSEGLRSERDHWHGAFEREHQQVAALQDELRSTTDLLLETQQSRSLRVARWFRRFVPSRLR